MVNDALRTSLPSFNPRPPRKVGATIPEIIGRWAPVVSILAHLARWALRSSQSVESLHHEVSILAHLARWALPSNFWKSTKHEAVSILAHLARWALQRAAVGTRGVDAVSILAHLARWALPLPDGTITIGPLVSILAHLARWALQCNTNAGTSGQASFNPRPPRKVGATGLSGRVVTKESVSILAHLARWALQYYKNLPHFQIVNPSIRRTSLSYLIVPRPFVNPHIQTPYKIRIFSHPRTPLEFCKRFRFALTTPTALQSPPRYQCHKPSYIALSAAQADRTAYCLPFRP